MCIKSCIFSIGQLFGLTDNALKRDFQNASVLLYEGLSAAMRGYQRKLVLENIVGY